MRKSATEPSHIGNADRFPAPAYAETVLAPAFALGQRHHLGHLLQLHRAHGVMLAEQGLLSVEEIAAILVALDSIEAEFASRAEPEAYTGEFEDMFFYIERLLSDRVGPDTAGRLHTGTLAQRYRSHAFQAGPARAAGQSRHPASRRCRHPDPPLARRSGYDHSRLHPRSAGATFDLRALSRRADGGVAARRDAAFAGSRRGRPLHHGRGGDHHDGVSAEPRPHGRTSGFSRLPPELLRLHRLQRLYGGRVRRHQGDGSRSRAICAGHGVLDGFRGRPVAILGWLRADQFDHAAEAQSCSGRASSADVVSVHGQVRRGADGASQHAVHRHERQRARGSFSRL